MTGLADFAARFCKMNCPVHSTEQGWPHDPDCETLQAAVRTEAMDALIVGDADLYDIAGGAMTPEQCVMVCPQCEGEGTYADGLDEAACSATCTRCESNGWIVDVHSFNYASARIKGDKDGENPVERPHEPEYDHTQDGTANFERALAYARQLEADADFSNSQYAFFMAERGDHLRCLAEVLEAICGMQALRYGDATGTHLALSALCQSARATLAKARGEQP